MTNSALSPADLAARTPAGRDRYLDFLRAFAIAVVVLGHWLMAVVWTRDGALRAESLLVAAPAAQWLTWALQVMPVFFLVGGAVNARSWRSARERGTSYAAWLRGRAGRLLRPTIPLVWLWAALAPVLVTAGLGSDLVRLGVRGSLAPLWFLSVYLVVVAAVPALLALHDRFGLRLVLGLAIAATLVDAVGRAWLGAIGPVNFFFVWAAPTALGFCWADGLLDQRAIRRALPVAGLILLLLAVAGFGYPVSMVGVPGAGATNNSPPSVALVLLGWVQAGIVLGLRAPLTRWLERPRAWAAVVGLNLVAMTVYLWHLTVMVLLIAAVHAAGWWPATAPLSLTWWVTRPLWLALLALVLVLVVRLLARVELSTPAPVREGGPVAALIAIVVASAAFATLVLGDDTLLPATAVTAAAFVLGALRRPVTGG